MMKESPQNRDEMTGGLSGTPPQEAEPKRPGDAPQGEEAIEESEADGTAVEEAEEGLLQQAPAGLAGIMPVAAASPSANLSGLRMPERLTFVRIADGRAVGLPVPGLGEREVVAAWRKALGPGPVCARWDERARPPPVEHVQRLARVGELWLDCALPDEEGGFELLVAGALRLVVWPSESRDARALLDSLGDSAVLGWDGRTPWDEAVALAARHGVPLLCAAEPPGPAAGADAYRVDLAATGRSAVTRLAPAGPSEAPGAA